MNQLKKPVLVNFSIGLAGRLFGQILSFFIVVYLARILGPADFGSISLVVAIVSYFNLLATFGLPTIGTREVARAQANSYETVGLIFSLRMWLAIFSYVLLFVYGWFFVSEAHLFKLLLLYGMGILSSAILLDWFFMGMEDLTSLAVATVVNNIFYCLFVFLLVQSVADIYYIPIVLFLGSMLASIYLIHLFVKIQPLKILFDVIRFRHLLILAIPFAARGLLDQFYENMDMIMLGYMVGSQEVGFYSVAYKIVFALSGIVAIYTQSTFPVMIRLYETNRELAGTFLKQNIHTTFYFMAPLIAGGTMLAGSIIEVFFGETYAPAVMPFILLLFYVFLMAISITLSNLLLAAKEDKAYFITLVVGAGVNIACNFALIPGWLSAGAAAAMVIAELFVFLFLVAKVKSIYREAWLDKRFLVISIGSIVVMALCIYGVQKTLNLHLILVILIGALVYMGISWSYCAKLIRRIHM